MGCCCEKDRRNTTTTTTTRALRILWYTREEELSRTSSSSSILQKSCSKTSNLRLGIIGSRFQQIPPRAWMTLGWRDFISRTLIINKPLPSFLATRSHCWQAQAFQFWALNFSSLQKTSQHSLSELSSNFQFKKFFWLSSSFQYESFLHYPKKKTIPTLFVLSELSSNFQQLGGGIHEMSALQKRKKFQHSPSLRARLQFHHGELCC